MSVRHQPIFTTITFISLLGILVPATVFAQRYSHKTGRRAPARTVSAPQPAGVNFCGEPVPVESGAVAHNLSMALMRNISSQNHLINFRRRAIAQYFPVIEPILKKYRIPDDFKYLAVVESGLKADAVSRKGAMGYWQLMPETASELGLKFTDKVDERKDLLKSTDAACRYLRILYRNLGSWTMVAAAYNGGIGRMQSHMKKQQESNYYFLSMNPETSDYLYKIVAVKEFFQFPGQYLTNNLMASAGNSYERERAEAMAKGLIPTEEPEPVGLAIEPKESMELRFETASVDSLLGALSQLKATNAVLFKGDVQAELVKPGKLAVGQTWQFKITSEVQIGDQKLGKNDVVYAVVDDVDTQSGQLFLRSTKIVSTVDKLPYKLTLICLNQQTGLAGVPLPKADQLKPGGRGWLVDWKVL
ncbi:lytic transglycosylase domain-containing protein [Larkinella rosea]|uniref:Lytic transglycosylase domain-containing protein n=1 Tax=Larkinella rosea TaxID=2025312 RepID=A0A3P1C418_9BACT|nr:lytic transglycosylase domain-containing protein [Larkinella rosea]RRB07796.1 lytic transglycosylase domain-containing protein [Larkinella rosea]